MITYEQLVDCLDTVVDGWGEKGKEVVVACLHENPFNDTFDKFLDNCTACGGNWGRYDTDRYPQTLSKNI